MAADTSNAVILERVEAVIRRQDETIEKLDNLNGCVRTVQIQQAVHEEKIHTLTNNQDDLKAVSKRNDFIGGGIVLGVVAAKEALQEILS